MSHGPLTTFYGMWSVLRVGAWHLLPGCGKVAVVCSCELQLLQFTANC